MEGKEINLAVGPGIPKVLTEAIKHAILFRKFMTINYNNQYSIAAGDRYIAPSAIGNNIKTGSIVLRAYLIAGVSYSAAKGIARSEWRLYLVRNISFFELSNFKFGPLPGYKLNDKGMSNIKSQLSFSEDINEDDINWWT
jgi:hypothetical protein